MCDDFTPQAKDAKRARRGLNRRQFAALGAGMALMGCSKTANGDDGRQVRERMVSRIGGDDLQQLPLSARWATCGRWWMNFPPSPACPSRCFAT